MSQFSKYKGKKILMFTKNNFRVEGKMTECDDKFIEIFDDVKKKYKLFNVDSISEIEVRE